MLRLIVHHVAALVPLLLIVTIVVWALLLMIPGDAAIAIAGRTATQAQVAGPTNLGLDRPLLEQYVGWLGTSCTATSGRRCSTASRSPRSSTAASRRRCR